MKKAQKPQTKFLVIGAIFTAVTVGLLFTAPEAFWIVLPFSIGSFVVAFNGL